MIKPMDSLINFKNLEDLTKGDSDVTQRRRNSKANRGERIH